MAPPLMLTRQLVVRAWRVRKLLDQAERVPGSPEAQAYDRRARIEAATLPAGDIVIATWERERRANGNQDRIS